MSPPPKSLAVILGSSAGDPIADERVTEHFCRHLLLLPSLSNGYQVDLFLCANDHMDTFWGWTAASRTTRLMKTMPTSDGSGPSPPLPSQARSSCAPCNAGRRRSRRHRPQPRTLSPPGTGSLLRGTTSSSTPTSSSRPPSTPWRGSWTTLASPRMTIRGSCTCPPSTSAPAWPAASVT
jgi:hypothetical protein